MKKRFWSLIPLVCVPSFAAAAAEPTLHEETVNAEAAPTEQQTLIDACMLRQLQSAGDDATVGALRQRCEAEQAGAESANSLLLDQIRRDRAAESIRFGLTPYRRNYILPVSYLDDPNDSPVADEIGEILDTDELGHLEAKFQISLKFGLWDGLLLDRDRLYFGLTALSFWQAYNRNVSAPFRETNYEPEIFWQAPFDWAPFGLDAGLVSFGVSHQSNGRGGALSRSWNRVYADIVFEKENFVVGLRPWWRIPEDEKDDLLDPTGDDNPDIEDYMGNFEFRTAYRRGEHEWTVMLRNNLQSDNKGAVQLDWSFPLFGDLRGYAQYFYGYGESLIDYNTRVQRIGIGIQLSDPL